MSVEPNHYLRQAVQKTGEARQQLVQFQSAAAPHGEEADPRVGQALHALAEAHDALHELYISRTTTS